VWPTIATSASPLLAGAASTSLGAAPPGVAAPERTPTKCIDVTFFGDDSDGEWGLFVRWASQEAASAALRR